MRPAQQRAKIDLLRAYYREQLKPSSISDDWDSDTHSQFFNLDNGQREVVVSDEVLEDMSSGRAIAKFMEEDDWEEQLRKEITPNSLL